MLTIAIVGRPNVGKSTLFNRLVGKRVAITLQEPGTTRDRIIQQGEWLGRRYWVIDTGGLEPLTGDRVPLTADRRMMKEIETQVELAIEESDIVLLLVDGREGLNPVDVEIARKLQHRKKEFLLVVNKLDSQQAASGKRQAAGRPGSARPAPDPEFYKLGVKELYAMSAEHGIGVADVLDEIFARFPEPAQELATADVKLVILGRPNVGKSSFLNALLGHYRAIVTEVPGTTRDSIEATFNYEGRNYLIVDTAGIRRKSRIEESIEYFSIVRAIRNIGEADIALLMLDIKEGLSTQDQHIAALVENRGKGLVIVANKSDLISDDAVKPVHDWLRATVPYISHVPIIFTSALNRTGILDVVAEATRVYDQGGRRLSKADLKEALLPVFETHPPRHGAVVFGIKQKGVHPPSFTIQCRDPRAINQAYLKFAERAIRDRFGFAGYPVRIRVGK